MVLMMTKATLTYGHDSVPMHCRGKRHNPLRFAVVATMAIMATACAGVQKSQPLGGHSGEPRESARQGGDPKVLSLVAAAGADAVLLAAIPSDPWVGLRKIILAGDSSKELAREVPWITSSNQWSVVQWLFGPSESDSTTGEPVPEGWDSRRPLVLAFVSDATGSALERINGVAFHRARVPRHVRVIVPAENPVVLGRALQDRLARLTADKSGRVGRYLLQRESPPSSAAIAVIPAKDHVRLELLYFSHANRGEPDDLGDLSQLERTVAAPRPRVSSGSPSATEQLVAGGTGLVIGVRPIELARQLELESIGKVMAVLSYLDSTAKVRILAAGLGEILDGHLLAAFGKSEIAEAALAVSFARGINAVSVVQLTATGQRQMSLVMGNAPLHASESSLASVSLAFQAGCDLKKAEPVLGAYSNEIPLERFLDITRAAGSIAWPTLFARPIGLLRKVVLDASIQGVVGDVTRLPRDAVFDLFDSESPSIEYRWRAYVPNGVAPTWANLARMLARAANTDGEREVQQVPGPEGTWLTWNHYPPKSDDPAMSSIRRSDLPKGTFASARVDAAKVARRAVRFDHSFEEREAWVLRLLNHLGTVNASLRLQGSWLIGEIRTETGKSSSAFRFEPSATGPEFDSPKAPPGLATLEQATAQVSELLRNWADASDRTMTLGDGYARLKAIIEQAKLDPATRADATALERMLLELAKYQAANAEATSGR